MTATQRQDGGDGASGMGAELDAGLSYEAPDLAFSTRLRGYAGKGGGHGPSLTSSRHVLWGGPARPELRIGIRFDLPFGIGGRGFWGDSCERRRLRELVRAVGPRINGDSARCHPMKRGKARLLGREGNCRNSKGCDIAILRTGRAKRWSESGDYVITALVTPKSNRVF